MQIIFTAILVFSVNVFAIDYNPECKTVPWPYSKNISKLKLNVFESDKRTNLYYYLYSEIVSENKAKVPNLGLKIYQYLVSTEQNEDTRMYLQSLSWMTDLETKTPKFLSKKELCDFHNKYFNKK